MQIKNKFGDVGSSELCNEKELRLKTKGCVWEVKKELDIELLQKARAFAPAGATMEKCTNEDKMKDYLS